MINSTKSSDLLKFVSMKNLDTAMSADTWPQNMGCKYFFASRDRNDREKMDNKLYQRAPK